MNKPILRTTNLSRLVTSLFLILLGLVFAEFYPDLTIWNGITIVGALISAGCGILSYTVLDEIARSIIALRNEWKKKITCNLPSVIPIVENSEMRDRDEYKHIGNIVYNRESGNVEMYDGEAWIKLKEG